MDQDEYIRRLEKIAGRRSRGGGCKRCSCVLAVIIIVCLVALYYAGRAGWFNFDSWLSFDQALVDQVPAEEQSDQQLTGDPQVLSFTAEMFTQQAQVALSQQSDPIIAPDSIAISINNDGIGVTGDLLKPVTSSIKLSALPTIQDGQLALSVTEVRLAGVPAPALVRNYLSGVLGQQTVDPFNAYLAEQHFVLTAIELSDGAINASYLYQP